MPDQRREDLEELVKGYAEKKRKSAQRRGRKPGEQLGPSERLKKNKELVQQKLATLKTLPGFYAAVALETGGGLVAGCSTREADYASIASVLSQVFDSAVDCSLRMDIGQFKRGVFEGDSGIIYLVVFDEIRVAILCDPPAKRERVEQAVIKFVEDELYK